MTLNNQVSAIIIGVHRSTAVASSAAFEGTPYQLVAVLDLFESPEQYQYSPQNFGVILHALHPRPRILITGTAVERIVPEVKAVWDEYVDKILKVESEDKRAIYVAVSVFQVNTAANEHWPLTSHLRFSCLTSIPRMVHRHPELSST